MDLWQGDSRRFVCDHIITIQTEAHLLGIGMALAKCSKGSHVVLSWEMENREQEKELFPITKDFLDQPGEAHLRRITTVLGSLEKYWRFQEFLFQTYPEPDA